MNDTVERFEHAGKLVEIHWDRDPESPREWDNLGKMVCSHKRYRLGDEQIKASEYHSWDEVAEHLRRDEDARIVLPLYLYDHSGITISVGSEHFRAMDSASWDWGQAGFIYVTAAQLRKEYSAKRVTKRILATAEEVLRGEVQVYDEFLTGQVYGYEVHTLLPWTEESDFDEDDYDARKGDFVDSCWGFFGLDCCRQEAKSAAAPIETTRNAA